MIGLISLGCEADDQPLQPPPATRQFTTPKVAPLLDQLGMAYYGDLQNPYTISQVVDSETSAANPLIDKINAYWLKIRSSEKGSLQFQDLKDAIEQGNTTPFSLSNMVLPWYPRCHLSGPSWAMVRDFMAIAAFQLDQQKDWKVLDQAALQRLSSFRLNELSSMELVLIEGILARIRLYDRNNLSEWAKLYPSLQSHYFYHLIQYEQINSAMDSQSYAAGVLTLNGIPDEVCTPRSGEAVREVLYGKAR